MNIEMHEKARSTLAAFAEQHRLTMEIHERTPRDLGARWAESSRYYACFKGCEIKEGSILRGTFGNGATPDAAMAEYAEEISEHKLVFNAYGQDRREIDAPLLTHNGVALSRAARGRIPPSAGTRRPRTRPSGVGSNALLASCG